MRVVNPIAAPHSVMRSSLLGSLIDVLRLNLSRKASRVRVFELAKVFLRDETAASGPLSVAGVRQPLLLAGLAFGSSVPVQWGLAERTVDFFDVKGDIESLLATAGARFVAATHPAMHPGRTAAVEVGGERIGYVGELHPRWRQAYELPGNVVMFELDAAALSVRPMPKLEPLPKQQPVWRDIAVVASRDISHDGLREAIETAGAGVLRGVTLFDIYEPKSPVAGVGEGERSMAIRLELRDDLATLTDERIDVVVAAVLAALGGRLGVRLRQQ